VTEEEFRSKLYVLGLDYQAAIKEMNAAPDQYLKERYRRQGYAVMAEISALEKLYHSQRGVAAPTNDARRALLNPDALDPAELGMWRQRLANKFAEGAHHDIIVYCAGEIEKLGVSSSAQQFHCPHCQQSGSIVTQGGPGEQVTTFGLYGHEYIGDGKFYCTQGKQRRIFQEPSLFQADAASQELAPSSDELADPWIAYHDQLVKEWFDGELALIDDLYPNAPSDSALVQLAHGVVDAGRAIIMFTSLAAVVLSFIWACQLIF
jgi:hypothetical protein